MGVTYERATGGVPCLIRILWFFFVGWWAAGVWLTVAWLLNLTIVGLPIGLLMLNRVPLVMTLQTPRSEWLVTRDGQITQLVESRQIPFILRVVYFILIGWWLSALWCIVGYLLCLSWFGLPPGIVMFNMVGLITTLRRR